MNTPVTAERRGLVRKGGMLKLVPVSPRKFDSLKAQGIIPSIKLGRTVLYNPDRVLQALEAYERKAKKN